MVNQLISARIRLEDKVYEFVSKHQLVLLRLIIISGVLSLSAALPYRLSARMLRMVPLAIPAIIGGIILYQIPGLAMLAAVASLAIPIDGPSGVNATMGLVSVMFGLWVLKMMINDRRITFVSAPPMLPLFTLLAIATLGFGAGQLPWYLFGQPAPMGAQLGGLAMFFLSAAAFITVGNQVKDVRWLEWMCWILLALSALNAAGYIIPSLRGTVDSILPLGTQGSLFWVWGATISFSQAAFNNKMNIVWRIVLGALAVALMFIGVFILRAWNSGWMPPLAAVGGILLAARPKWGLAAMAIGSMGVLARLSSLIAAIMIGDNEYSLSTRIDAWLIVWRISRINPLLGLGPANYYRYTPLFPIRGYAVEFNSHSQFIDLIAQTGILGLIAFIWFFIAVGIMAWRLRNRVPEGFAQAYVYGCFGGVVGTFISAAFGDWVIPFFYNIGMTGFRASVLSWLFLGGLLVYEKLYPVPKAKPRS